MCKLLSNKLINNDNIQKNFSADCEKCFGLCCVALPYAKSADFAFNKDGGTPCRNLQADYRCGIHKNLRNNGFRGCTVYECFGAGQKVSQVTYNRKDWRDNPAIAKEMFDVFPIMQQLHEMLCYLNEALSLEDAQPIYKDLQKAVADTERLTYQNPKSLLNLHVPTHRAFVNDLLLQTSELVRAKVKKNIEHSKQSKIIKGKDLIGANLRGANLRGTNLRGVLLIASDLREADLRMTDLIGADFRDADLSGANLIGSIFLTQAQVNSAKGDIKTKLPPSLSIPKHWLN
jgi:uncharacterized protein YjbI with pentapeptide repeats